MITFNGKYLQNAAQGNMRINAMSLGSQDLLGTLAWLNSAVKAILLAAFGQGDGMKVISATIDYLSQMANTDKDKALALQGYISEDPMLVCSLGLEPQGMNMPIRWLTSDNTAWIETSVVTTLDTSVELKFVANVINGALMGGHNWSANSWLTQLTGYTIRWHWANVVINPNIDATTIYDAVFAANYLRLNGTEYTGSGASKIGETVQLFRCATSGCESSIGGALFKQGEQQIGWYVPCTSEGVNGMRDLLTGSFYSNANTSGAFTISYTLPDGTPWTPLNEQ